MGDATVPGCSEVGGAETGTCVNDAGTMNNDGLEGTEDKVDIIARKKQTDADSEIYYAMHPRKNKTPTKPDNTNKIPILIRS